MKKVTFRTIILVMTLLLFIITFISVYFMHTQQKRDITEQITVKSTEALQSWVSEKNRSIENLESYLFSQFAGNESLDEFSEVSDPIQLFQIKNGLLNQLKMTVQLNGSAQGVFLCIPQAGSDDDYLYLSRYKDDYPVAETQQIRADILDIIHLDYQTANSAPWAVCRINGCTCLLWIYHLGEYICGAWIDCQSYLAECSRIAAPSGSIVLQLVRDDDEICSLGQNPSASFEPTVIIEAPSRQLGVTMIAQIDSDSLLSQNQIRFDYVLFSAYMLLILLIVVVAFQLYMYSPIGRLTKDVAALREADEMLPIYSDYQAKELYDLSQYINQSIEKLKKMKIDNYEALLSEQQMAQEFLLMRHKTHFFINCMSVIHALAGEHDDDLIQELSRSLIGYLRKIDFEKQALVRLNDELSLIHSYISIQKVRFGDSFRFIEEVPIDLFEAGIPPLILQTFVENAVEHGRIHQSDNIICLSISYVDLDGAYLRIHITDNGSGFPEKLLEEFNSLPLPPTRRLSQGHGVGICNAIARLKHIYGDRAVILIENVPGGGAHVRMDLPIVDQEE